MGNKQEKHLEQVKEIKKTHTINPNKKVKFEKDIFAENIIWIAPNENVLENNLYQGRLIDIDRFNIHQFNKSIDCIEKLKTFEYKTIYIIVSALSAKEFFIELEKIINKIKFCPIIMIFSYRNKFYQTRNEIFGLEKCSLFNINLVFDNFNGVIKKLSIKEKKYQSNHIPPIEGLSYDNCFAFEYIQSKRDLIFPLTFMEFMEVPNKTEIYNFNQFLLDKYYKTDKVKNEQAYEILEDLLNQLLLMETNIPIQILVKYWVKIYTLDTYFYREMNLTLTKKLNNNFDIYIRALYHGFMAKAIKPVINEVLYRGSLINVKEINLIKAALENKKEKEKLQKKEDDIPPCICFNKSFFSTRVNKKIAMNFAKSNKPNKDLIGVLFIIEKKDNLDEESATNFDAREYSYYDDEGEIIFFPFSCFEIIDFKKSKENEFCEIYLSYIGKYKDIVDTKEKIPDNNYTQTVLSSQVLEKIEMSKEENKDKFEFPLDRYIPPELKQSYIIAVYEMKNNDINKKKQILNWDEKINKAEIKKLCNIYLNGKKIDFTLEYIFNAKGKYIIMFEFTELLTKANKLFYKCDSLISLDFSKFKSNFLKDMTDMFNGCDKITSLDLSNLKTKDVYSMKGLFKKCISLKSLDISSFNTDNVTDMSEMFCECSSLSFLNLSHFKSNKVKTMQKMFYKCSSLFYINLMNCQSDNVRNISEIFEDCTSLNYLDLSLFELNEKINKQKMFFNCSYFEALMNEYISELDDTQIENKIKAKNQEFFTKESQIMSNDIKFCIKEKKYQKIEILNKSIEKYINEINNINILIIGNNVNEKIKSIKQIIQDKKENLKFYEYDEIDCNKMEDKINNLNKNHETKIDYIWICVTDNKINDNINSILNKLIKKYENNIYFFIIYINSKEKENNFIEFKEDIIKTYKNKNLEIINFSSDNIQENISDIIDRTKNNFINIIYHDIQNDKKLIEIIKINLDKIKPEKNLDDLPTTFSEYFEKLLGKSEDINYYIESHSKTVLNYTKREIDTDTINNFIELFIKKKLKIKIPEKKSKSIDIKNIDDELTKEITNKYNQIFGKFYGEKFKQIIFNFFVNFLKSEAENIIIQTIKSLKIADLKPLLENNFPFGK